MNSVMRLMHWKTEEMEQSLAAMDDE